MTATPARPPAGPVRPAQAIGARLTYDLGAPGRRALRLPESDVPEAAPLPEQFLRRQPARLPEMSQIDLVRYFNALSRRNYGVETGFYPLGSCTMKYNPKVNEDVAAMPGFADIHPLQPDDTVQGVLAALYERRRSRPRRDRGDELPPPVVEEAPPQESESETAGAVRQWCEEVLRLGGFEVELRTAENDAQIVVKLYGRDTSRMLDRHGELLDALQVLANKALVGRRIEKDIELDCGTFKEKRVEELGERARATAERVRREGREQLLPAMSPIERRIVHLALQDDQQVMTESRGDGWSWPR